MEEVIAVTLFGGGFCILMCAVAARIVFGRSLRNRFRDALPRESSALEVLNERYARGEIDHAEYLERRSFIEELTPR